MAINFPPAEAGGGTMRREYRMSLLGLKFEQQS